MPLVLYAATRSATVFLILFGAFPLHIISTHYLLVSDIGAQRSPFKSTIEASADAKATLRPLCQDILIVPFRYVC